MRSDNRHRFGVLIIITRGNISVTYRGRRSYDEKFLISNMNWSVLVRWNFVQYTYLQVTVPVTGTVPVTSDHPHHKESSSSQVTLPPRHKWLSPSQATIPDTRNRPRHKRSSPSQVTVPVTSDSPRHKWSSPSQVTLPVTSDRPSHKESSLSQGIVPVTIPKEKLS